MNFDHVPWYLRPLAEQWWKRIFWALIVAVFVLGFLLARSLP